MAQTRSSTEEQEIQGEQETRESEPRGFGEHSRGLASEYAHEQGWGLNEPERTRLPEGRQPSDGGTDYEYGARDFGDEPADTSGVDSKLEKTMEKALGATTQAGGERTSTATGSQTGSKTNDAADDKEEGQ